ncbi:MAG: ABC transporter permease [Gammaproteobacteria bacterium]|nr:ABC transporter permease [Gammaproteobacteria bacterium]
MILVALQSIRANLFRGFLTMLGIIIGVGSVIAMVALGTGAQHAMDDQINSLGASVLTIRSGRSSHRGVNRNNVTLTLNDAEMLTTDLSTVTDITPETARRFQVKLGNNNQNIRIVGTRTNFSSVHGYKIAAGRMFSLADDAAKRRVAVLGHDVTTKLDKSPSQLIGKTIHIKGITFEIIGVFEKKGTLGWQNADEQIWIPLDTALFRMFGLKAIEVISAKVAPDSTIEKAIVDIERVLRREHKIMPGEDNDFSIGDPREFFNVRQAATDVFAYLLASIAGISLIVGGIGIMNIMLVTVTERTREIGIRKALGATRFNILMQFLVEAMILCMIGGSVGILLGTGIATAMTQFVGWQTIVSPAAISIAFLFSAGIGLIFGILPARKAARLDPIEALRYE